MLGPDYKEDSPWTLAAWKPQGVHVSVGQMTYRCASSPSMGEYKLHHTWQQRGHATTSAVRKGAVTTERGLEEYRYLQGHNAASSKSASALGGLRRCGRLLSCSSALTVIRENECGSVKREGRNPEMKRWRYDEEACTRNRLQRNASLSVCISAVSQVGGVVGSCEA